MGHEKMKAGETNILNVPAHVLSPGQVALGAQ